MVLKLYGHPMSTCKKRVVVVLKETNTPFHLEVVDLASASSFYNRSAARELPLIFHACRARTKDLGLPAEAALWPDVMPCESLPSVPNARA
jgi:hypothetical protein